MMQLLQWFEPKIFCKRKSRPARGNTSVLRFVRILKMQRSIPNLSLVNTRLDSRYVASASIYLHYQTDIFLKINMLSNLHDMTEN